MAQFDFSKAMDKLQTQAKENKTTLLAAAGASTAAIAALYLYKRSKNAVPKAGPYPAETLPADAYDAVVVGAGALLNTLISPVSGRAAELAGANSASGDRWHPK